MQRSAAQVNARSQINACSQVNTAATRETAGHAAACPVASLSTPSPSASRPAGFVGEVKAKYTAQMAEVFRETFCWLPLGYVLAGKVLVVSGYPRQPAPLHLAPTHCMRA